MMRRTLALLLLGAVPGLFVACPRSMAPPQAAARSIADAGREPDAAPDATPDATPDFSAALENEVLERLSLPMNLFLAHEQDKPRGYRGYSKKRQPPSKVHHARMFTFGYVRGGCSESIVDSDGTICGDAVYPGAELDEQQTARALEILKLAPGPGWKQRPRIRCFEPHHAVVFFDERGAPVADIMIDFDCGNFRLTPGPHEDETAMTAVEGMSFADTCRALDVGGCPPRGSFRMPEWEPHAGTPEQTDAEWRRKHFTRPIGVPDDAKIGELNERQRAVLCLFIRVAHRPMLLNAVCDDGGWTRTEAPGCGKPKPCEATVGELVSCARARFEDPCGKEPPSCAKSDACRWAVFATEPTVQ